MAYDGEIYEIFSWLPASIIHKFSIVSKPCRDYLSSHAFQKLQSRHSSIRTDADGYFVYPDHHCACGSLKLIDTVLPGSFLNFVAGNCRSITSSNGLVLCRKPYQSHLLLFNPATRKVLDVAAPRPFVENPGHVFYKTYDCYNVIFECVADDYQLVAFDSFPGDDDGWSNDKYKFMIYSLNKRDWEDKAEFDIGNINPRLDNVVFLGDQEVMYCLCDHSPMATRYPVYIRPYITVFDFNSRERCKDGTIEPKRIKLPRDSWRRKDPYGSENLKLFKWQQRQCGEETMTLCLVRLRSWEFTIWVLEDLECLWRRILKVKLNGINRLGGKKGKAILGYVVTLGKNLVFATSDEIYQMSLREGEHDFRKIKCISSHDFRDSRAVQLVPYLSILRPCY